VNDSYKTIKAKSEGLFKDKGSKFLSYAFPVETEEEIKDNTTVPATIVMPGDWERKKSPSGPTTTANLPQPQENQF